MDIVDYNARWLAAWSAKDVEALLGFYAPDCRYVDQQVPHGIEGHDALRAYLTGLFGATPPMSYNPDEVWPVPGGFCGRWFCVVGEDPRAAPVMRGFDLVILKGDRIALNEVYAHPLAPMG